MSNFFFKTLKIEISSNQNPDRQKAAMRISIRTVKQTEVDVVVMKRNDEKSGKKKEKLKRQELKFFDFRNTSKPLNA